MLCSKQIEQFLAVGAVIISKTAFTSNTASKEN
jgi:hypothetical protein